MTGSIPCSIFAEHDVLNSGSEMGRFFFKKNFVVLNVYNIFAPMEITKVKLMTVKEYADKQGCTVQNVYHMIKVGKVKCRKLGYFHFVEVS